MYKFKKGDSVLHLDPGAETRANRYGTVLDAEPGCKSAVVQFPSLGPEAGEETSGLAIVRLTALEPDLRPQGYAPGDYTSECRSCGKQMHRVDKRSTCCKVCALARFYAAVRPVPVPAHFLVSVVSFLERLEGLSRATAAEWEAMPEGERAVRAAVGRLAGPAVRIAEGLLPEEIKMGRAEGRRVAFEEWVAAARARSTEKGEAGDA